MIALLPDEPRWVEVRSMLMSGRGEVAEIVTTDPPSFVVFDASTRTGAVVGGPPAVVIERMAERANTILAEPERIDWVVRALRNWPHEIATLHVLGGSPRLPRGDGRPVTAEEIAAWPNIPDALRQELLVEAGQGTTIYATFAGNHPASFCYAGSVTERLWDVSIDTLEPYRRQGYGTRCAAYAIEQMRDRGKEPVWGTFPSNAGSAALARKLGFVAVDTLAVFTRS